MTSPSFRPHILKLLTSVLLAMTLLAAFHVPAEAKQPDARVRSGQRALDIPADWPTCNGQPATIVGTDGNDVITGTTHADVIVAGAGDDLVYGLGGADIICLGDGRDQAFGQGGNDIIFGDGGNDYLNGGRGGDTLNGGDGNDLLRGHSGNDSLDGGAGDDTGEGGNSANSCTNVEIAERCRLV